MAIDFDFVALLQQGMATDIGVRVATDRLAEAVADRVREGTPTFGDLPPHRGSPAHGSAGDAKDAIKVESHPSEPLGRRVISHDFKALWIEVGTRHMPEYAPFTKAAAYYGAPGPILNAGLQETQHNLRNELEKLAKVSALGAVGLKGGIAKAEAINKQKQAVHAARTARSSAFKAARGPRRRGRSR